MVTCRYCRKWASDQYENMVFCNKTCYLRWRYGVPKDAKEVDGAEGMLIGHSELAMHTGHAGHFVSRLWCNPEETYGYAVIKNDLGFLHGSMHINDQHNISLS